MQFTMLMQAAPWESAADWPKGGLIGTETSEARDDFAVSGIVIEPSLDPPASISSEQDAQSNPPAAAIPVCSRRMEQSRRLSCEEKPFLSPSTGKRTPVECRSLDPSWDEIERQSGFT